MGTTVGLMLLLLSSRGMVRSQKVIFCQLLGYLIRKTCVKYPIVLMLLSNLNSYHVRRCGLIVFSR